MGSDNLVGRRTILQGVGAGTLAGLAGCLGGNDGDDDDSGDGENQTAEDGGGTTGGTDEVEFILNPAESDVEIKKQYQPLFDHIESETGVSVTGNRAADYAATLQALRSDRGQFADTSPSAAVAGKDVADVVGIRVAYGAAQYFSLITTTPDSGIESLSDLEGEEVAMGDPLSVSGTLVPLTILQDAGLDVGSAPDGDPVDFTARFSDHTTAREQLINNPSVAAATTGAFSTAPHVPQEQFDQLSEDFVDVSAEYDGAGSEDPELQLLAVSDPIPRAPIMVRSNWDDPVRSDIERAILDAGEADLSHGEDYEGDELWFTNVVEGGQADYQPIQRVLDELGLEFEDIS